MRGDRRHPEFGRLAEDYAELRHYEKAIDATRTAMRAGEDAAHGMNVVGNWYGRLQDRERAEPESRRGVVEASSVSPIRLLTITF